MALVKVSGCPIERAHLEEKERLKKLVNAAIAADVVAEARKAAKAERAALADARVQTSRVEVPVPTQNHAVFNFGDRNLRVLERNGEPWFVAVDVCEHLGLGDVSKACSRLDEDEGGTNIVRTPSGDQNMLVINESGLYSLTLTSRKPEAKRFKKWVTSVVLPSIRKTGSFNMDGAEKPLEVSQGLISATCKVAKFAADHPHATQEQIDFIVNQVNSGSKHLTAVLRANLSPTALALLPAPKADKAFTTLQRLAIRLKMHPEDLTKKLVELDWQQLSADGCWEPTARTSELCKWNMADPLGPLLWHKDTAALLKPYL